MLRRSVLSWFALLALLRPSANAGEAPRSAAGDPAVELPPFVITETRTKERPWRYAAAEGFEIISQVGDESTQQVFAALWRGPRLTLPPALWPRLTTPTAVIIFDQEGDRTGGPSSMGSIRQRTEQSSHWTNVIKRTLPDREVFCVNLSGRFFTYSSTFRFDLRTLLALRTPAAPPWLLEALYGSYGLYREGIEYPDRGKVSGVVRALWCSERDLMQAEPLVGPGREFFLVPPEKRRGLLAAPSPLLAAIADPAGLWTGGLANEPRSPEENARWAATCALLARWGIYAREGKHADAFWRLAVEACARPVDEALVRECLGLGYAELRNELAWYLPIAVNEAASRPISPLVPPTISLRPATTAEVARVRGDWERGEATLLAGRFPEIAAKYAKRAGQTLRQAQAAEPDDPRLLEVLGLYEFESGNSARALELLTAATAAGSGRPRAWFTLAHLRFLAHGTGGAAKSPLSHEQALQILLPLERTWAQEPAMVVTYELLAELWRRCPDLPAAATLARLQEGQRKFPRNTRYALTAFRASVERGERRGALELLEAALPFSDDPAMRERLEKTREALLRAGVAPR